ncbi:MAG: hypothetical protein H8D87_06435 [Deltaproteobacteria bacterium]|nr:hypothetical protein [Candidatus Desulfobacula maris]
MGRKKFKTKYYKFRKGTISRLSGRLQLHKDILSGWLSGSRRVNEKNAEMLSEKFREVGIDVPVEYWAGKNRGSLRKLIINWYKEDING